MKKKYIIFDLDGTLINSTTNILNTILEYFKEKYPELEDTARYYFLNSQGQSLIQQLEIIFKNKEKAKRECKQIYSILDNIRGKVDFFPGVIEKIKELKNKGYIIFLSTGSSTNFAKSILKKGGIDKCFDIILGSDKYLKGDEHIEIFKNYTNDNNFTKKAIYIGDGNMDKYYANKHNIEFIRVGNTCRNNEKCIKSIKEIDKFL